MMKTFFKNVEFKTDQNNLLELEPKLRPHLEDFDFFSVIDLTDQCYEWVKESKIENGFVTLQILHTTCVITINELDEPCLLGDINITLRDLAPKTRSYLHNSSLRTKNLCVDDKKCDRNGDAHVKASLYGSPTQTVIIRDGKPLFGRWQRICLIDFDGPRDRNLAVQVIGE